MVNLHHRKLFLPTNFDPYNHGQAFWVGRFVPCDDDDDDKCKHHPLFNTPLFPPPPPPPYPQLQSNQEHHFPDFMIPMCSILAGVTLLLCYLIIFKRLNSNSSNQQQLNNTHEDFISDHHGPVLDNPIWYINTVGLQQSIIDSIAVFKYKKGEGLVEGTDCSVCLSEFEEDESLRLLPKCSHAFHVACIDAWLRSHTNCPLCRAPITCSGDSASPVSVAEPNLTHLEEDPVENLGHQVGDNNLGSTSATDEEEHEQVQQKRRAVSMDSYPLAMATSDSSTTKLVHAKRRNSSVYRLVKSSSFRFSLQKGPVSMKRSFSYGGKPLFPMSSRS